MDRDRERDRRPFPREDQYGDGRGQSYRPPRSPIARSDTYRARSPPRGAAYVDSYRGPPRGRSRSPLSFRRRSRSPPPFRPRDGGDSYRGRARSPPPPRRGDFMRDESYRPPPASRAFRDEPYSTRSPLRPLRDRSPLPLKRPRDISPAGSRGRRSPPPAKRERLDSPPRPRYNAYPPPSRDPSPGPGRSRREMRLTPPRGVTRGYRLLSRSPIQHNENVNPRKVDNWRRRSPSPIRPPPRTELMPNATSGAASVTSSRRSSPPIHPSRLAVIEPEERITGPPPQDDYPSHQLPPRAPSPLPAPQTSPAVITRPRSPIHSRPRSPIHSRPRSPIPSRPRSPVPSRPRSPVAPPPDTRSPPRRREPSLPVRERDIPTGPSWAPPTGPARQEEHPLTRAPPTGPSNSRPFMQTGSDMPIPTGPRTTANSPPTYPRGGPPNRGGFQREYPSRDFSSRGDFSGHRGRGGYGGPAYRGGRGGMAAAPPYNRDADFTNGPPTGPRNSMGPYAQSQSFRGGPNAMNSNNNNNNNNNYQRPTRFGPTGVPLPTGPKSDIVMNAPFASNKPPVNPYLADLPRIIDGGLKAPDLYDKSRLDKLEDEAEKMRRVIDDKQVRKRRGLREWTKLSRDSEAAGYRAQLADDNVRALTGESDGGPAF